MSNFSAFMAENVEKIENKKVVVSKRFKDENGNPMTWEIQAITSDVHADLMKRATVQVPVVGQRGQYTRERDSEKFMAMFLAASVVYPDLNDAKLQDSYGVKTPHDLIKKMLYPVELGNLGEMVAELSGVEDLPNLIEEAKN